MQWRMQFSVGSGLMALALLSCSLFGGDGPGTTDNGQQATNSRQDVVFVGESRPVLLRLQIWIDGLPFQTVYRTAWNDYLTRLFRHLDRNGDGTLDEKEAERLPPPQVLLPGTGSRSGVGPIHVAFNFRALDTNSDGRVTLEELMAYYRGYESGAFQAQFAGRIRLPQALNDELFTRLDTNKDGKLSRDELAAAEASLFKLDADGDEILTPQELAPRLFPADGSEAVSPQVGPGSALPDDNPFIFLTPGDAQGMLARRLLARYGSPASRQIGKLSREELGLDPVTFQQLDRDRDGKLDADELQRFAELPADVELIIRLGKRRPGEMPLEISAGGNRLSPPAISGRKTSDGTLVLTGGKTQIELRCHPGAPHITPGNRQRVLEKFQAADADHNGSLDQKEARAGNFYPELFTLLDRDGDGKVTEKELLAYLEGVQPYQVAALGSRAALLISDEGRGLFELLDKNRDGRLGLREVRAARQLLADAGQDGGALLRREDIPHSYQLVIGLGQASLNRSGSVGDYSPPGLPLLSLEWAGAGPLWFRKMDRNHDGDVSPAEFLGRREDFQRIDADGDGLISVEEAERAGELFPGKKN